MKNAHSALGELIDRYLTIEATLLNAFTPWEDPDALLGQMPTLTQHLLRTHKPISIDPERAALRIQIGSGPAVELPITPLQIMESMARIIELYRAARGNLPISQFGTRNPLNLVYHWPLLYLDQQLATDEAERDTVLHCLVILISQIALQMQDDAPLGVDRRHWKGLMERTRGLTAGLVYLGLLEHRQLVLDAIGRGVRESSADWGSVIGQVCRTCRLPDYSELLACFRDVLRVELEGAVGRLKGPVDGTGALPVPSATSRWTMDNWNEGQGLVYRHQMALEMVDTYVKHLAVGVLDPTLLVGLGPSPLVISITDEKFFFIGAKGEENRAGSHPFSFLETYIGHHILNQLYYSRSIRCYSDPAIGDTVRPCAHFSKCCKRVAEHPVDFCVEDTWKAAVRSFLSQAGIRGLSTWA